MAVCDCGVALCSTPIARNTPWTDYFLLTWSTALAITKHEAHAGRTEQHDKQRRNQPGKVTSLLIIVLFPRWILTICTCSKCLVVFAIPNLFKWPLLVVNQNCLLCHGRVSQVDLLINERWVYKRLNWLGNRTTFRIVLVRTCWRWFLCFYFSLLR